jgi:amino acid adenylation domain-containing protein
MSTPAQPTLYEWFARSVERLPDAVALEVDDHEVTYRELGDLSAALAARLVDEYGGVPDRVALLASRSLLAFAGYLAITRLGAVVVPLNPGHPIARGRDICAAARPDVLLADAAAAALAPEFAVPHTIVDPALSTVEDPVALPPVRRDPDAVAYILFTSGSTGRPKGVPVRHRNVSPFVAYNVARFGVGPGCRMSHTFELSFDVSVFDLFVTWAGGATLVCPRRGELVEPVRYVAERRLTHWISVPSVVSVAAELGTLHTGLPNGLRHSVFCGEQLTLAQARAWHAAVPGSEIVNAHGPTETTVLCADYPLPADETAWPRTTNDTVPIALTYPHLESVVVDAGGHLADEGELCLRGAQRFDGYLDPADNAGRFVTRHGDRVVAVPDGPVGPQHYYRTGDVVRRDGDAWVHVGRTDHQVQVRGHRVELGEVEAALRRADGVHTAVVVATRRGAETELVGFYTGTPPVADVRRAVRRRLPIYMVPRRLVQLPSIPLNANGKFDRPQLRELAATSRPAR